LIDRNQLAAHPGGGDFGDIHRREARCEADGNAAEDAPSDEGNGAGFNFETTDPYRDSVFAGAGVTAQFGKNLSGSVFYNVNFGSQTYQSNMVSVGLNVSF